jgi:hypothetical protein
MNRRGTEYQWNDNDRRRLKYSEKNPSQCPFIHLKCHMDRPGIELGLGSERLATNRFTARPIGTISGL